MRQEQWPYRVVGSVVAPDIDAALSMARRQHGRWIYVSTSYAPPVNTLRYLEA